MKYFLYALAVVFGVIAFVISTTSDAAVTAGVMCWGIFAVFFCGAAITGSIDSLRASNEARRQEMPPAPFDRNNLTSDSAGPQLGSDFEPSLAVDRMLEIRKNSRSGDANFPS